MKYIPIGIASLLVACAIVPRGDAGSITGVVTFKGEPRQSKPIDMGADSLCEKGLGATAGDEKFLVGPGTGDVHPLANVFVYVKSGLAPRAYPVPAKPVVIDQHGCRFSPHVAGLQVGQEVQFQNSDRTMHNVHVISGTSPKFNRGMPSGSPNLSYTFTAPECMARLRCDAHPWMACYLGVVEHPYFAVTGLDGQFTLAGIEDGEYTVEIWQEVLQKQTAAVTVTGGVGIVNFQYAKADGGDR